MSALESDHVSLIKRHAVSCGTALAIASLAGVLTGCDNGCIAAGPADNNAKAADPTPWVEVVSVGRSDKPVNVVVGETNGPIILVLSAANPVRWNLVRTLDARVVRVLMSGNRDSYVSGAQQLQLTHIGDAYALPLPGDLAALDAQVRGAVGLPLMSMQVDEVALSEYHIGVSNVYRRTDIARDLRPGQL
jgi:hypothetical protein